jgi:phage tail-like protein
MAQGSDFASIATFEVKIDNVTESNFIRVSGVGIDVQDMATNTKPGQPSTHVPGGVTARDITMVRHFNGDKSLYKWLEEVKQKGENVARRTGSIRMLNTESKPVAQFDFEEAWIKSWAGPELAKDHQGNTLLQETIVVSVGDVKYV